MKRRRFIIGLAATASTLFVSLPSLAAPMHRERRLRMYNTNTKESLSVVYWFNGRYSRDALRKISYFWRDHRQSQPSPVDIKLINLLWAIETRVSKGKGIININSAYRTEKTNNILRKNGYSSAKNSQHIRGGAIDFFIPGYKASHLASVARDFRAGGVGYYQKSNFIHIDTGPIRYWNG